VRYQSSREMLADLKRLKRDTASGRRSVASGASAATVAAAAVSSVRPGKGRRVWVGVGGLVALGGVALAVWWASTSPHPRVTASTRITSDGAQKGPPLTDGSRLYFGASRLGGVIAGGALAQVAAAGGETVQLAASGAPAILDIDQDGAELLVTSSIGTGDSDLAVMPVLGGTQRRLGNLRTNSALYGNSAAWSPDKSRIVYTIGSEVRAARSDGSESRSLVTAPGLVYSPRWSPDGERLRYSVRDTKTGEGALWEAKADGTNAHALLPGWKGAENPCCGIWTRDGRYYVFEAAGNIWALPEARFLQRRPSEPVQLTFGPMWFSGVMPSRDGKRLFVVGDQRKGRLARYDAGTKQFVPYLDELSAEGIAVSGDGRWVAYTAYPEGTLWRSRTDGSERLQLTSSPALAALPRWSPDGNEIAYFSWTASETPRIYMVSAAGGSPRRATSGVLPETDLTWAPDGKRLAFGSGPGFEVASSPNAVIRILALDTGQVTIVPGSQGLFSPRWSPDGRFIAALSFDSRRLMLFDLAAGKWTELIAGTFFGWESWSPDSRSISYQAGPVEIRRIAITDRRTDVVVKAENLDLANGLLGSWIGSAPDGAPLVLLDAGTHDIYALDWEAP
jgi:Tol biopolymer transport system component